jgi:hypothetical protein
MIASCLRLLANDGWIHLAISESYADVIALATALHHAALAWTVTRHRSKGRRVYDLLDDLQSAGMESLSSFIERPRDLTGTGSDLRPYDFAGKVSRARIPPSGEPSSATDPP